jgi:hypothetical protein
MGACHFCKLVEGFDSHSLHRGRSSTNQQRRGVAQHRCKQNNAHIGALVQRENKSMAWIRQEFDSLVLHRSV